RCVICSPTRCPPRRSCDLWGPPFLQTPEKEDTAEAAYYLSANRNKQSISLDIASQEGADVVRAMARECAILVENFKVGGLAKYRSVEHTSELQSRENLV